MDFFRETCAFGNAGTALVLPNIDAGTGLLCDLKMNPMPELQPDLLRGDDFRCCHAAGAKEKAQVPRAALTAAEWPQHQR
jgi:hypothetical protein